MSSLTAKNVAGLDLDYEFELIPDCPAATAAGYTDVDRSLAQVWYAPLIEGKFFYYTAWSGGILSPTHKSSILICRHRKGGRLIYAINCRDYGLDTAPNLAGDSAIIVRVRPFILGRTLYLCNGVISNIGPQLYAIDKRTGLLKYACAYYPPPGVPFTTQKGDYSQFRGSNRRVSDLCPVGAYLEDNGVQSKFIFVGTSSFQNINLPGAPDDHPVFTDQGFLFCIKDTGCQFEPYWAAPTCAPLLQVGDTLIQGGNPAYDPFPPGQDYVALLSQSTSTNLLAQPYFPSSLPAPAPPHTTPITGLVRFTPTTVINPQLVQPVWALPDLIIYEAPDRSTEYTLVQLLDRWIQEQASMPPDATITHTIWTYLTGGQMDTAAQNEANVNLIYFKQMFPGQTITQPFDAVSLNYWGNSTWGGPPTLDLDHNLVYFGTGQSHAIPLGENLLLSQPQYNFSDLKIPVVDIITQYAAGTATLADVNQIKDIFVQEVQNGALDLQLKSPRGQMSYADAILGVYIMPTASHPAGTIAFGSRVVAADTYSFIPATPELLINPSSNSIDGDVSSGVALIKKGATRFVTTAAKSGLSLTLDLTNFKPWAQMKFNHANLSAVGVMPQKLILNGPNGFLGGSNYLSARAGSIHVSSQANMAWADGSVGSKGELEFEVTPDGQIFEINNSFIQGVDILTHKIIWSTPYNTRAGSQVVTHGHIAFAGDSFGSYYAFSTQDGHILWKYNAKPHGINGGIVGPQVAPDGQVIWINNYSAQGIIGQPGPNGIALRVNPKIMIRPCDTSRQILAHRTFKSWDTAPKLKFANPVIAPINNVTITHQWISKRCVDVIHQTEVTVLKATFAIKKFNAVAKIVTFVPTVGTLVYYSLRLINAHIYELRYEVEGVPSSAWLEIDPRSQV